MTALRLSIDPSSALWSKMAIYAKSPVFTNGDRVDYRTVVALRMGQTWAQDRYLDTFWPTLESEVRHYAHKGGDSEELRQEAALALWEAAFRYDPALHRTDVESYVKNYMHRLVRETYVKALTEKQHQISMEHYKDSHLVAVDKTLDGTETEADLETALLRLSPKDQALMSRFKVLTVNHGMGLEEAARYLAVHEGGTAGAWKKKIQRLRHKWRVTADPYDKA